MTAQGGQVLQEGWPMPCRSCSRLFLALLCILLTGCVYAIDHQPNPAMFRTLPRADAERQLQQVLRRARQPVLDEVTITDDYVQYHLQGTARLVRLGWAQMGDVAVFNNHAVFVHDTGGAYIAQLFFATAEDARQCADLLLLFREKLGH
jgi:hypothetical protein